jgi:DNA-binding response OmpR family regulator
MKTSGGRTLSILVVEDDTAVAELIRALLNRVSGWGATVVHDAAAAREVFAHVHVEALVLDVNLPGISGVELLELLEKDSHWHNPPVILMSANANQEEIHRAMETRPHVQFIPKPFDVDEIVDAIEEAVAGSMQAKGRGRRTKAA